MGLRPPDSTTARPLRVVDEAFIYSTHRSLSSDPEPLASTSNHPIHANDDVFSLARANDAVFSLARSSLSGKHQHQTSTTAHQLCLSDDAILKSTVPNNLEALLASIIPFSNTDSNSIRLDSLFPSLADKSFSDIVPLPSIYLKRDAISIAASAAPLQHNTDPSSVLIDQALVLKHSDIAQSHGLPALLGHLFGKLSSATLQPLNPTDSALIFLWSMK